jgi:hypothetical protein
VAVIGLIEQQINLRVIDGFAGFVRDQVLL